MSNQIPDIAFLFAVLTSVVLLPFFAILVSSFTKIAIVLNLMRTALGTQQAPPSMVINATAIMLSFFIMAPIVTEALNKLPARSSGSQSYTFQQFLEFRDGLMPPLKSFLQRNTKPVHQRFFLRAATRLWPKEEAANVKLDDFLIVAPAFTISEVTEAFQIGFVLYLAFIIIDLVVGAVLLSMGMSMISPTTISIPLKILLFVALDGWSRLIEGLVLTYVH